MQQYFAVNGEIKDINVTGNRFLDKLTFPLWDKVGIPRPLPETETNLIARMLRNYAKLQRIKPSSYFWEDLGWTQDSEADIIWVEEVAEFFEQSGGLLDEDVGEEMLEDE